MPPWSAGSIHIISFTCFLFPRQRLETAHRWSQQSFLALKMYIEGLETPNFLLGACVFLSSTLIFHLPSRSFLHSACPKRGNGAFCIWKPLAILTSLFLACKFISYILPTSLSYYLSLMMNVTSFYHTETQYCSPFLSRAIALNMCR